VVAFGMILPPEWLQTPTIAPLNIHASLLPRWRGAAPIERALLAGDRTTGVCLMHMEQGLDTGAIYARREVPITATCSGAQLWQQLSQLGARVLIETLPPLIAGRVTPTPQGGDGCCYAAKITAADRTIKWQQPATLIDRQVRCFAPKPGARCKIGSGPQQGRWLKLLSGSIIERERAAPGSCRLTDRGIAVGCGAEGSYLIHTLQPEGRQEMTADSFWHGLRSEGLVLK
ncbi:MAG: methionyl-tRNA formyltransferase, partial [Mariprofundales bacterium]|nr:methionyl-tRNA formyltransferase [Mariprofundales bacterium]